MSSNKHAPSGKTGVPEKCPLTGLPVQSRPEWTDVSFGNKYSITLKVLGNNILFGQHVGYVTKNDVENAIVVIERLIA